MAFWALRDSEDLRGFQLVLASLKTAQLDKRLFDLHFALGVDNKVIESTKCGPIW